MLPHLNKAKFSTPSSEMVETRAIGRGTMPLIMRANNLLSIGSSSADKFEPAIHPLIAKAQTLEGEIKFLTLDPPLR